MKFVWSRWDEGIVRPVTQFQRPNEKMNKFNEYDVVEATRDLSDTVYAKATGTVLLIFKDSTFHYEVEFFNGTESLGTLTVKEADLQRRRSAQTR